MVGPGTPIYAENPIPEKITAIDTGIVEFEVLNPEKLLRPGVYVNVLLVLKKFIEAVLVPENAIVLRDDKQVIFSLRQGSTCHAVKIPVTVYPGGGPYEIESSITGWVEDAVSTKTRGRDARQLIENKIIHEPEKSNVWRMQGRILAILVLLFFLRNLRSPVIISVVIPVSLVTTFSLMNFGGLTINIVSLMGITLGEGIFLDNSIDF